MVSTHVLDTVTTLTHAKDVGGGLKTGLTVGAFAIGFPTVMLLNLLGFGHVALLVVFTHIVLITILTSIIVIKLKKA